MTSTDRKNRYCLAHDGDHEYFIPVDKKKEWYKWMDSEDFIDGIDPSWATRIDGNFTFADPECN